MFLYYNSDFFRFNFNKNLLRSQFSVFSPYNNHSVLSLSLYCNAEQFCNVSLLILFAIVGL